MPSEKPFDPQTCRRSLVGQIQRLATSAHSRSKRPGPYQPTNTDALCLDPNSFAARFFNDPVAFVQNCSRPLSPYQQDILAALVKYRRVAVRGPHGLGKTTLAAWAVLWFALTRDAAGIDWKVATTAGVWRQLTRFLWPEIRRWARRIDWEQVGRPPLQEGRELLDLQIKLRHGEAFAFASDNAALIEGAHASQLLYLFDEAKAIPSAAWDSAEGAFSTGECYWLAVSTPGDPSGRFYDIHRRKPGYTDWWCRHVKLKEAIAAGRIDKSWAEARRKQWGAGSAIYKNRVEGEFAAADERGFIPLDWVEQAIERWWAWQNSGAPAPITHLGVDIGLTTDRSVVALRSGRILTELRYLPKGTVMQTTGHIAGILSNPMTNTATGNPPISTPVQSEVTHVPATQTTGPVGDKGTLWDRIKAVMVDDTPVPSLPAPISQTGEESASLPPPLPSPLSQNWERACPERVRTDERIEKSTVREGGEGPGMRGEGLPPSTSQAPSHVPTANLVPERPPHAGGRGAEQRADRQPLPERPPRSGGRGASNESNSQQWASGEPPRTIIDVVGIGAGAADRLRELGYRVISFNAAERAEWEGKEMRNATGDYGFVNKRAAGWSNLYDLLDPDNPDCIALPPDDILIGDLTAPHAEMASGGKLRIEAKSEIQRRLGRSTDAADAVMQAFFPDPPPKKRRIMAFS